MDNSDENSWNSRPKAGLVLVECSSSSLWYFSCCLWNMNISSSWPRCWGWWPGWLWWWEGYWWMHCSEVAAAVGTSSVSTPATTYCSTLSTVHSTVHCTVHTVHLLAVSLMWTFAVCTSVTVHPTITVRVDSELCTCICDLNNVQWTSAAAAASGWMWDSVRYIVCTCTSLLLFLCSVHIAQLSGG